MLAPGSIVVQPYVRVARKPRLSTLEGIELDYISYEEGIAGHMPACARLCPKPGTFVPIDVAAFKLNEELSNQVYWVWHVLTVQTK